MAAIDPDLLLRAYAIGVFPMSDGRDAADVYWVEPRRRAILPLDGFHLSRSLRKTLRSGRFTVSRDRAFAEVIRRCAERPETWINAPIEESYRDLHARGGAHSIEVWEGPELVGGLYGVRLAGAFFGESMFSSATDASKVALAWLVARLRVGGFNLLDCQFMTDHLRRLGAVEISQKRYLELLAAEFDGVLGGEGAGVGAAGSVSGAGAGRRAARGGRALPDFGALELALAGAGVSPEDGAASGCVIAQLLTQTS
jgi:leucyl/phenylalanyl-tRNA---protein transferase